MDVDLLRLKNVNEMYIMGYHILNINGMIFSMFGQFSDKTMFRTVSDGQLPKFLDIGRTSDRYFLKLAPLVQTPAYQARARSA